jgi:hypothetical protein
VKSAAPPLLSRRSVAALLAGGMLILACGRGEKLPTYRYRLTVEVDTPEGLRSGSSVIEVRSRWYGNAALPDQRGIHDEVEGEAVAVDLGTRGMLFATLRTRGQERWPAEVVSSVLSKSRSGSGSEGRQRIDAILGLRGVHVVPRQTTGPSRSDNYPLLVRFENVRDPRTAMMVDPDDLQSSFGQGVALRRITVSLTDDGVTHGIESRLPILAEDEPEGLIDTTFEGSPVSQEVGLGRSDFRRAS